MTNDKENPCLKRLDAECFKHDPEFFKRAFALRLLFLLTRGLLSRLLPQMPDGLPLLIIDPDVDLVPPIYVPSWEPGPPRPIGGYIPTGLTVQVISNTQDGCIRNSDYDWATCRNDTSGNLPEHTIYYHPDAMMAQATAALYYRIRRGFYAFDLTAYAGKTLKAATLNITYHTNHEGSVCAQEGTQSDTLINPDYDNFTGTKFGTAAWIAGLNTITFGSNGISYIQSVLGGTAKICCREYQHDYRDIAPAAGTNYRNGCYFADDPTPANRPYLELTF